MAALPLYSRVLVSAGGLTGTATLDVPAGFTVVVRDIDVVVGISVGLLVYGYAGDGVKFAANAFGTVTEDFTLWSWRGRQVIPGPDTFNLTTTAACDVRASGYLLSGVAP